MDQTLERRGVEDGLVVTGVTSELFHDGWPFVKDHLKRGLAHSYGELDLDDLYDGIADKRMQLWVAVVEDTGVIVAAMVTEIVNYPKIKDWAKSEGCSRVEGLARDGWVRVLKEYGFRKLYNLCGVDI